MISLLFCGSIFKRLAYACAIAVDSPEGHVIIAPATRIATFAHRAGITHGVTILITRISTTLVLLALFAIALVPNTQAQANLLENPGFNNSGSYQASRQFPRGDFNFAPGWDGWQTNSPSVESWQNINPIAFPHTGSFKREGDASQNIGRGDATFTAAAFQVVGDIAEGTTLRANVWVFQDNDENNGVRTRIGIGSNVGANPLSAAINWSPWTTAIDSWQIIEVEATVPAGNVTVFIYSTQDQPNIGNQVYYDDATLIAVGQGEPDVGEEDGEADVPPPPTSPPVAPFVSPQQADDSGRIEHTVQPGDTLAAIAVAYGVSVSDIRERNNLGGGFLQVGQVLLISEGSPEQAAPAEPTQAPAEPTATIAIAGGGFTTPTPAVVAAQPTAILATPTTPPPAPVITGSTGTDPLTTAASICVEMFEDANQNRLRDPGETLLANGILTLNDDVTAPQTYTTDGTSEPFCFQNLTPGRFTLSAQAPQGFGITTSQSLVVSAQPGQSFNLSFGAAPGVAVAQVPTDAPSQIVDAEPQMAETGDPSAQLRDAAGLFALAAAGVVLAGGALLGLATRGMGG